MTLNALIRLKDLYYAIELFLSLKYEIRCADLRIKPG